MVERASSSFHTKSHERPRWSFYHPHLLPLLTSSFVLLASLPAPGGEGYTNHAGHPVPGVPVALDARTVTLSNATESLTLPLSIFPEEERRRIAAEIGRAHV